MRKTRDIRVRTRQDLRRRLDARNRRTRSLVRPSTCMFMGDGSLAMACNRVYCIRIAVLLSGLLLIPWCLIWLDCLITHPAELNNGFGSLWSRLGSLDGAPAVVGDVATAFVSTSVGWRVHRIYSRL